MIEKLSGEVVRFEENYVLNILYTKDHEVSYVF